MSHLSDIAAATAVVLVWVVVGCAPPEDSSGGSSGNDAVVGESCTTSEDCQEGLHCQSQMLGRVCLVPCQSSEECGSGNACQTIPDNGQGYCDFESLDPDEPFDSPEPEPEPQVNYPQGPYGTIVGDTLQNQTLLWPDGSPLSFSDLRSNPDNKLLLIFNTASWCSRCTVNLPDLQALDDRYSMEGLIVMVAVFEDRSFNPASAAEAGSYKDRHDILFDVVADSSQVLHQYFSSVALPMVMAVELDTMTLLYAELGWFNGPVETLITENL